MSLKHHMMETGLTSLVYAAFAKKFGNAPLILIFIQQKTMATSWYAKRASGDM